MLDEAFLEDELRRRRHPVRRFAAWLLLIVVLLAGAVAVFIWHYQPLTYGDTYGVRGDQVDQSGTPAPGGPSVVTYSPGQHFDLVFAVGNGGRVQLRVLDVPDNALAAVLSGYEIRLMPPGATAYDDRAAGPFRPLTLHPGESRTMDLRYTFKDCGGAVPGSNRIIRSQPVRYELAGRLRRTVRVTLAQPLVITGIPDC